MAGVKKKKKTKNFYFAIAGKKQCKVLGQLKDAIYGRQIWNR
jgi:hypothetical protein